MYLKKEETIRFLVLKSRAFYDWELEAKNTGDYLKAREYLGVQRGISICLHILGNHESSIRRAIAFLNGNSEETQGD